jgi:hypothetical protein
VQLLVEQHHLNPLPVPWTLVEPLPAWLPHLGWVAGWMMRPWAWWQVG